jgi:4-hydroxybenzoate polyprenyltransferase
MKTKEFLKFAWDEFIYGGHLLSFGAVSIVVTSAILLSISITWDFLVIVYLITYTVYLYNRFIEYDDDFLTNQKRTQHIKRYIKYMPCIVFCSVLVIVSMLLRFSDFLGLTFGLSLLLFGLLYSISSKKITKNIIGFKSFYVSFIWASLVIFLVVYYSLSLNLFIFLLFIFVFLRWMINTIFFDIKDIESDKENNLKTIPILIGKRRTLNYLQIINILSFSLIVFGVLINIFPTFSLSLLILCLYSFYYFKKANSKNVNISKLSCIIVDGEYLFWPIILFLSKFVIYG